jgi:hypothetical protein
MRTALRRRDRATQEAAQSASCRQPALAEGTSAADDVLQIAAEAARQWLNTPMVPALPRPGPTAQRSNGLIGPAAVPRGALPVPAGTIATRCVCCDATRLHYPGVGLDPWRDHADPCAPRPAAAGPRNAHGRAPGADGRAAW